MRTGVASSNGWIALAEGEYEKEVILERTLDYLKIMWTHDTFYGSDIILWINDDESPIILEDYNYGSNSAIVGQCMAYELDNFLIEKFRVVFNNSNPYRKLTYFGYY